MDIKILFRGILFIFIIIILLISLVLIYLLIVSRGQVEKFTDFQGNILQNSLAEKINVNINGMDQGMFIRGKNIDNPVLLFIHGGPGVPEYFLNETYKTSLEDHFTVCWWEARGGGLSFDSSLNSDDISVGVLVEDAISVSEYLKDRFNQEKIFLMGHSFGSLIGVKTVQARPDLFKAYIGMAQLSGSELSGTKSNTLTYNFMKEYFNSVNDQGSLKKLNNWSQISSDGRVLFDEKFLGQLDELKHKAGCGTMHNMKSAITGIFLPNLNSRCYTFNEKVNYWRGKSFMKSTKLFQEVLEVDLFQDDLNFNIPVYFFSGIYDYTCPYPLMREYYEEIQAPVKGFYTFKESAHSPLWEEGEKAVNIMVEDVLNGRNELSDEKI